MKPKYILVSVLFMLFQACKPIDAHPVTPEGVPPTAQQWNKEVVAGWNLGNQLECNVQGIDGESVVLTNPSNAITAETAWGNPVVTKKVIKAVGKALCA